MGTNMGDVKTRRRKGSGEEGGIEERFQVREKPKFSANDHQGIKGYARDKGGGRGEIGKNPKRVP